MHPAQTYALTVDVHTLETFRALVEAIIPNTPALSVYGAEQSAGAVDLCIHEYMIWELDHNLSLVLGFYLTVVPLSASTATMLNASAVQFVASGQAQCAPNSSIWESSPFSSLSPVDRIRVLAMLEQLNVDLGAFPPPYRDDGGFVRFMVDFLNRQTMFGYYSEWSAYGTTRLATPTERRLESFPLSWRQVGYPGVVPGYRALRGYLLTIVRKGGESTIE
ncbi:MAG: gluconate 2-dehydrogenase subunit 3 family protein [Paenibacillus sp.]|nr:gluconate 2-dehydrogenase subunit 3 family protein [Paenibacillus sp.]